MDRIKKVFKRVHIGFWLLFGFWIGLQMLGEDNPHAISVWLAMMSSSLYVFYMHFGLLSRYSGKKKKKGYWPGLLLIILTGALPFLLFRYKVIISLNIAIELYFMVMVTLVLAFLFLSWLARVTENLVLNTFRKEQLEKQAVEAELYYLRSQINPHFLFNTLNNIHTLVFKQSAAAPEAVMRLASLMRYMIYESNSDLVALTKEMEYLQDYMSLQQLRYKASPVVDLEISGNMDSCYIAPLLFIHILENAYKHSPARAAAGDIRVRLSIQQDTLTFSVQNPLAGETGSKLEQPGGIGLRNVRKRLALLYPEKHSFEIHTERGMFSVILSISGLNTRPNETQAQLLYH